MCCPNSSAACIRTVSRRRRPTGVSPPPPAYLTHHGYTHPPTPIRDFSAIHPNELKSGAVGSSADNAATESLFASLKREILPGQRSWPTARAGRLAAFRWLGYYNQRRHSAIGYLAPVVFEQRSTTWAIAA
ncbi:integrase core domain-containing protein [Streptomyces sp. NPDC002306]